MFFCYNIPKRISIEGMNKSHFFGLHKSSSAQASQIMSKEYFFNQIWKKWGMLTTTRNRWSKLEWREWPVKTCKEIKLQPQKLKKRTYPRSTSNSSNVNFRSISYRKSESKNRIFHSDEKMDRTLHKIFGFDQRIKLKWFEANKIGFANKLLFLRVLGEGRSAKSEKDKTQKDWQSESGADVPCRLENSHIVPRNCLLRAARVCRWNWVSEEKSENG